MPTLVHLTPEKHLSRIVRNGIRSDRGVYCMPVLSDYYVSHQWLREMKRSGARTILAVYFRLPADEIVLVGHYGLPHEEITVDEAVRVIHAAPDARGYEIIVPRRVEPSEIVRVRRPRQVIGWRFSPTAKGRPPCGCRYCARGEIKARKRRDAYEGNDKRPYPDLLAELRVLAGADERTPDGRTAQIIEMDANVPRERLIASRIDEIGYRQAGTAADLLFLLDYPHDDVAESLAIALGRYRGRAARTILLRLCEHPADGVREMAAWSLLRMTRGSELPSLQRFATDPAIAASIADYTNTHGM